MGMDLNGGKNVNANNNHQSASPSKFDNQKKNPERALSVMSTN